MLLFILWSQIASGPTRAELEEKLAVARDTERIEILNQLAELLVASDPTKSLQYAEDARTQSTELRDPLLKARALKNMGMANQVMGRYEEAQRSLEQALLLLDPETSPLILAECYTTLGLVAENQAHYEQALDYHQQAIQRLAKLETPESLAIQAKAFNGMGIVHYRLGNIQRTLDYFEKSLAVHRRIGNAKGIAGGLNNTGIMLKNLGKYDEALRRYEEALAIQHTQNNYKGMADVLNNMAVLHWLKKDFASCLATHRRSFDMYEQAQDPYGMGLSLGNIAHILGEMGRFSEAEQALTQAFDKADEIGSKELKRNLTKSKSTLA
ncbi:MAG: tetratricopeptide repeat protein [Acidobacteria bacterium]|nr:tetratricopeptide repeat protein [Acidobacteriota bacterium]